ncbi:hypothetical protein Tco_0797437 [Tanacetum coccineum]
MVEEEPVKKMSKKELLKLDEELAFKLQAEEDEEERLAREKAQKVEEANIAWDDIQAKVEADYQLAQILQAQEQEELSDAEKATLFMLKNFDNEDLEVLWSIVKERFKKIEPVNYMDTFLHLNLKTMFEHHLEDNKYLYYLMVENCIPLTKHTPTSDVQDAKLQVDYECEMAFELLRLLVLLVQKLLLLVLKVNVAGIQDPLKWDQQLPSGTRSSHRLCSFVPSIPHSSAAIIGRPSHSSPAGSSRKRSRSPTTSVSLSSPIPGGLSSVHDDLLPPRKMIRSSEIVMNLEDCLNEHSESSIPRESSLRDDIVVKAERIDVRVVVEAVAREEVKMNARGPVEVRVERVTHPMVSYDIPEPAQDEEL